MLNRVEIVLEEVRAELEQATRLHGTFHTTHEALGVLQEEFDEFKQEVYDHNPRKGPERNRLKPMRKELIQVAAMSLRAILDLELPGDEPEKTKRMGL